MKFIFYSRNEKDNSIDFLGEISQNQASSFSPLAQDYDIFQDLLSHVYIDMMAARERQQIEIQRIETE